MRARIYDEQEKDPMKHIVSIAFWCGIMEGESKPGAKAKAVESTQKQKWKI
jgi:hypothetical protein